MNNRLSLQDIQNKRKEILEKIIKQYEEELTLTSLKAKAKFARSKRKQPFRHASVKDIILSLKYLGIENANLYKNLSRLFYFAYKNWPLFIVIAQTQPRLLQKTQMVCIKNRQSLAILKNRDNVLLLIRNRKYGFMWYFLYEDYVKYFKDKSKKVVRIPLKDLKEYPKKIYRIARIKKNSIFDIKKALDELVNYLEEQYKQEPQRIF